jgi:hypothetical protein
LTASPVDRIANGEEPTIVAEGASGLIVVLSDEVQEDQAEAIASAIRLFRGVVSVQASQTDPDEQVARERVNAEWRERIVGLLDDEGV